MGNCQATDAATLVIQHPSGKVDKLYWPVNASEVLRMNPGHHVALLISTTLCSSSKDDDCPTKNDATHNTARLTRIKLLKLTDTLVLGQVYRLITTQDVIKGLAAKKQAKMMKTQLGSTENNEAAGTSELEDQATQHEKHRSRTASSTNIGASNTARSRLWQPSLQSISETAFPAADVSNIFNMKKE